jgi:hypothetical protein
MSDKTESVADCVATMRRGTKIRGFWRSCDLNEILAYRADRIEAAWKREKAEVEADALEVGGIVEAARTAEKSSAVGNAAAMREALESFMVGSCVYPCVESCGYDPIDEICMRCAASPENDGDCPYEKARKALAAPPRNCDVGTPEEQAQRFHDFCVGNSSGINGMCKLTCPCIDCFDKCQCLTKWAQTPYAEEGGAL